MRTAVRSLVTLLLAVACGKGSSTAPPPDGPVKVGVIAGDRQVVAAAPRVPLPKDVVVQSVMLPNGQVGTYVHRVTASELLLRAVLPEMAYAQTAVQGVAGLVSCNFSPDPRHALIPKSVCATGDATGKAYFTYLSDTVAGHSTAQIVTTVNTLTQVTDSVSATILPLPTKEWYVIQPIFAPVKIGDTVYVRSVIADVRDKYNNVLTSYLLRYKRHSITGLSDTAFVTGDRFALRKGDANVDIAVDSIVKWQLPLQVAQ